VIAELVVLLMIQSFQWQSKMSDLIGCRNYYTQSVTFIYVVHMKFFTICYVVVQYTGDIVK